jgi:excisionase family DNA binding protein
VENEGSEQTMSSKMNYILQKEILTFEEACIYLDRSASSMYKLTSGRLIPHYVPTGKLIYFKRIELDEWVLHNKRCSLEEIDNESERFRLNSNKKKSNY